MFAVIHLPDFALQAALRYEPELWSRPVALVDPAQPTLRIGAMTDVARGAGVIEGQTAVQALARCREVIIRHRSLKQEAATTAAVLQAAYGFSPNLEHTAPGIVTLDLRGLAELRSEADPISALATWARRLQAALAALQLTARVGTGPAPNVARHAARWSKDIELVADAPAFIASLPVAALEPSGHVADVLRQWDIHTVGELLALGQGELAERFGLEAFALFAAASAGVVRPLNLVRPAEQFDEAFEFDPPVETLEPLLFLLRRFTGQLDQRLEAFGFVAESLRLTLRLESGAVLNQRLRLPQPSRTAEVLFRMLHTHLESVRTDAPILAVALTAEPTRAQQKQFSLFEAALRDPHQFQETLARLSALVGADRVGTPVREDTHRPDAFKLVPPDFENAPDPRTHQAAEIRRRTPLRRLRPAVQAFVELAREASGSAAGSIAQDPSNVGQTAAAAGVVIFPPPSQSNYGTRGSDSTSTEPFVGSVSPGPPQTQPVSLRCSVASGRITVAVGPWHASGNWWDSAAWEREEWEVQTHRNHTVQLVHRDHDWFVEGIVD